MRPILTLAILCACDGGVTIEDQAEFETVESGTVRLRCAEDGETMRWEAPAGAVFTLWRCDASGVCSDTPYSIVGGEVLSVCQTQDEEIRVRYLAPVGMTWGRGAN
jgi:hypothetical protein